MSEEKAKENANPLSAFKGLGEALRWATGLSVNDNHNVISCGARGRDNDNRQQTLQAIRDGR